MLRGRPYTGEMISSALFGKKITCLTYWAVPLLTFAWNVVMPVAVLGVCIAVFRSGGYRDMWVWRNAGVRAGYWPHWARQIGVLLQLIPLLCIPVTALIQTYRYLSTGPPDILDVSLPLELIQSNTFCFYLFSRDWLICIGHLRILIKLHQPRQIQLMALTRWLVIRRR